MENEIEAKNVAEQQTSSHREERLVRLDRDHGYLTSRDYDYLYEAAKERCFVCFVAAYGCRDIAATNVRGDIHSVGARGIGYVDAHTKSKFVEQCSQVDLEFIPLPNRLANDTARCDGVWVEDAEDSGWREGCETCLRRTAPRSEYHSLIDPPAIIAFWCEYLIEP